MNEQNGTKGGGLASDATLLHVTAMAAMPVAMSMLQLMAAIGKRVDITPGLIAKNAVILAKALIDEQTVIVPPPSSPPK